MSRADKRAAALRELAEFKITPGDQSTTAGEDLAESPPPSLRAPQACQPR